ncbi:MFS transporter-like protein 140 [Elsinoe australis]|uniref:MFS transporter-like protein 140 n=1 Tax=Elsinoe australis TaxID=40998 RepID=A0A4U7AU23_9PEZI|nr:MFS transporter-like protein 140 [Elsinoe australis]
MTEGSKDVPDASKDCQESTSPKCETTTANESESPECKTPTADEIESSKCRTSEANERESSECKTPMADEAESTDDKDPVGSTWTPSPRFKLAWTSICIVALMAALDATSLSVALPQISKATNGTAIEAFWAGTSFLLTSTVFQPILANLSGIFGRKPFVLIALVFFLAGAIVAATARNMTQMLVGRSFQGIGGGGILVLIEILATDLVPLRQRPTYLGGVMSMWAIGSVAGPVIGGAFASGKGNTWTWIFWINVPFTVVCSVFIILFLTMTGLSGSWGSKLKRVDWIGMISFILSMTSFLIPLTWGGVNYAWSSWHTLVPLLLGAAGMAFFIVWEEKFAQEPLVPLRVAKTVTTATVYIATLLHGMILWCGLYYAPLYFEAAKGYSAVIAGVSLFPSTFTIAPCSVVVGIIVTKTGKYRWTVWAGWVLACLGYGLEYLWDADSPIYEWVIIQIVTGVGTGLLFPGLAFVQQAATNDEDMGAGVGLFVFMRTFGQMVGIAVGGVIFQNQIMKQILTHSSIAANARNYAIDSSALVQVIKAMPEGIIKTDLVNSYADALKVVWAVNSGLAFVGLVLSLFMKEYTLDRELKSKQQFEHPASSKRDTETETKV